MKSYHPSKDIKGMPLTEAEKRIPPLVYLGLSNKEIAQTLGVVEKTIKFHLTSIYRKLGVSNRTQLAVYMIPKESPPAT